MDWISVFDAEGTICLTGFVVDNDVVLDLDRSARDERDVGPPYDPKGGRSGSKQSRR
jgi:hypothetical protein